MSADLIFYGHWQSQPSAKVGLMLARPGCARQYDFMPKEDVG